MWVKQEYTATCIDCGAEIVSTSPKTLRCRECHKKHIQEYKRNWKGRTTPITEAEMARRAAKAAQIDSTDLHFCDSLENIQKCLSCERKKCNNCLR